MNTGDQISKPSTEFISYSKYNDQEAWPFWYSFLRPLIGEEILLHNGLGIQGIAIAPGQIIDIPITLEPDYPYRLINLKYSLTRFCPGTQITGTITPTAGTPNVVGVGTTFTDLVVGVNFMWVNDAGLYENGIILTITDNTNLILEQDVIATGTGVNFWRTGYCWYDTVPSQTLNLIADLTGTISIAANAITGVATLFVGELTVGDIIQVVDDAGVTLLLRITIITDNTNANIAIVLTTTVTAQTYKVIAEVQAGTISVSDINHTITGIGTDFLTDTIVGDAIYYSQPTGEVVAVRIDFRDSTTVAKYTGTGVASIGVTYAVQIASNPTPVPRNLFTFYQLTRFVRASLIVVSSDNRYLYGALQTFLTGTTGLAERRVPIAELQGSDDGLGNLRTPYLNPLEGSIKLRVENIFTETIFVNGSLFGYKLALELD